MSAPLIPMIIPPSRMLRQIRRREHSTGSVVSSLLPPPSVKIKNGGSGDDAKTAVVVRENTTQSATSEERRERASRKRRTSSTTVVAAAAAAAASYHHGSSHTVSARYDSSIVYLIDEVLTRGIYTIFARWFSSYLRDSQTPGCAVIVGYIDASRYTATAKRKRRREMLLSSASGDCCAKRENYDDREKEEKEDQQKYYDDEEECDDASPPYVRVDPSDRYPIFDLKQQLNYPSYTILLTIQGSRLERTLNCDGCIALLQREKLERSMRQVSEILSFLTSRYLNNYVDFAPKFTPDDENDIISETEEDCYEEEEEEENTRRKDDSNSVSVAAVTTDTAAAAAAAKRRRVTGEERVEYDEDDYYKVTETVIDDNAATAGLHDDTAAQSLPSLNGSDDCYLMSRAPVLYHQRENTYGNDGEDGDEGGNSAGNNEFYKFLLSNTMRHNAMADATATSRNARCTVDGRIVARNSEILKEVAAASARSTHGRLDEGNNISLLYDETNLPSPPGYCRDVGYRV